MQLHQLDARCRKMLEYLRGFTVRTCTPITEISASIRDKNEFAPFTPGEKWGVDAAHDWMDFKFTVKTPENYTGKATLTIATGKEGLWEATAPQFVVWVNGKIEQAFDTQHTSLVLDDPAVPGKTYDVLLQGYANIDMGGTGKQTPPTFAAFVNDVCEDVVQLIYDIDVPYQAVMLEDSACRDREKTLFTISDALNLLDLRNPYSDDFHASIAAAREFMSENYYKKLETIEPEAIADTVGHTHIDVAWLWDLYQTRHKAVRSFATMLKLMEQYPEFKFMSSQAQLYAFVKEDQPELFSRIQKAVKDGRWEVEGGMWVEADCNLSGGEALVRQFLYGNEFFMKELGQRSKILWLPDVFGYSAALPQILKKSGIDYFFTSKLSWSEFNLSPYDTFDWKGIDGTKVLTHFTPSREFTGNGSYESHTDLAYFTTYNAFINPSQVKGAWQRFQQKGLDNHFLMSYGYGDGGGGTTDWMIENARRMKNSVAGTPAVRQTFARDFFDDLAKRVEGDKRLPVWSGELYLEYHRGTYTAQAQNKRNNRKIEIELREVELWREYALKECGLSYPDDELRSIWRRMLTLQFHDILPGSSIHKVYTDSDEIYAELFKELASLKQEALDALAGKVNGDIALFNSLSFRRDDIVWFDAPEGTAFVKDALGNTYPVQFVDGKACAFVTDLPPMSVTPLWFVKGEACTDKMAITNKAFETPFFKGAFDKAGRITSLVDLRCGRELAKEGKTLNSIVCYENRPHNYDAWDINIYYDEHSWEVDDLVSSEIVAEGPVLTELKNTYKFNNSTIEQTLVFYKDIDRIDFKNVIDWKEQHYLLKAHFPVDIFYNEATYDIQYGNVKRPTHRNTSWDVARFEVCAHKWMDVSEANFGFALMNDCKYGHSADENGIALTMLKSSTYPDPTADQKMHYFTYSIMPHMGDWRTASVPDMAYMLNIPVTVTKSGNGTGALASFASVDAENVLIESVKDKLDGEGTVIRLYECYGERSNVTLTLGKKPESVNLISLMEDDWGKVEFKGNTVEFEIKPYEIVSFLVK